MATTVPMRCKCRRHAATSLRCARCSVPICPDCSVVAPVGMMCRDCSRGKPSHLYEINPSSLLLALPVTLLVALFGGWLMSTVSGIGFFGLFLGFLYGMGVGEVSLRLTGRKRGLPMEILVGACTFLGILGGYAIKMAAFSMMGGAHNAGPMAMESEMTGSILLTMFLFNPWSYVTIGVSVFGAVTRVRNI